MPTSDNVFFFPGTHGSARARLCPERLTEARLAARLTQTEIAERIGVSRQAVSAYELGIKAPDPETMRALASELKQPISFFTKQTHSAFGAYSPNFFRKIGADTKRRNLACDVYARWFAASVYTFDAIANLPSTDIPQFSPSVHGSSSYSDEEIEDAAEQVRLHFGLGWGPISNVVRLVEVKGVCVCRLEIGENIEAFSYWSGDRPFIFLASDKRSAARARFDVAHELGHLCLHRWVSASEIENPSRLKQIEGEANRFAGAFLLPRRSFPNEVYSSRAEAFIDLKSRWKVAIQAMAYRCKDLGILDERQVTNLYKQISFKKWRTLEPLDGPDGLPLEQPILLQTIFNLIRESGVASIDDLCLEAAVSRRTLEQLWGLAPDTLAGAEAPILRPTLK